MPQLYPCYVSSTQSSSAASNGYSGRSIHALTPMVGDGATTGFSIADGTSPSGPYLDLYLNGILQTPTINYTYNPANNPSIVFTSAPAMSDIPEAVY